MKRIQWLASYPKSGNTWLRAFLANLLSDEPHPVDINRLDFAPVAGARALFDHAVGYEAADLTFDEVDRLRPEVYAYYARHAEDTIYLKVHDAYVHLPDGRPLIPTGVTRGVIYVIRNPLDVCVSWAYHSGHEDYDRAAAFMADPEACVAGNPTKGLPQLRQRLKSWSEHVLGWMASGLPVHGMRYEDMRLRPMETFAAVAAFVGKGDDPERVARAVRFSDFDEMKRQERERGFCEREPGTPAFFREGRIGGWRERLTEAQAMRIIRDHGDVMRRFGYLTSTGEAVY
jgi:hypothetical protein